MVKLKYFKPHEFDQRGLPGSGEKMDDNFLLLLDALREKCDFPLVINSGYRSPEYNAKVSSTGLNGPHTTGKAVDVRCFGTNAYILVKNALELGFSGIGVAQKGAQIARFVHLDTLTTAEGFPRPWLWTY